MKNELELLSGTFQTHNATGGGSMTDIDKQQDVFAESGVFKDLHCCALLLILIVEVLSFFSEFGWN